jgi:pyridoxamine 5'-phosphate oxidase
MSAQEPASRSPFSEIRVEYRRGRLSEGDLDPNPLVTFAAWFDEARQAKLHEPNAMTLATIGLDGHPAARVLLLKGVDPRGFCFFTNYASRKGEELAAHPWAALVFWWGPLERQVRVEGHVERLSEAESDAYFQSRPRGARLGAWVSAQSQIIPDRQALEARLAEIEAKFADKEPPRPPYWGGYRLVPTRIEFWQGGTNRLHDRLRYVRTAQSEWRVERLSP